MRIVFFRKQGKMSQHLTSAAVVIGAFRVKYIVLVLHFSILLFQSLNENSVLTLGPDNAQCYLLSYRDQPEF